MPISINAVKVYIAAPYTKGDVALNVANAISAADVLLSHGFAPFVPHLTHFWHMMRPRAYEEWLALDNVFVACCDCVLRLPGESSGADKETALAESMGMPVFREITDVVHWYRFRNEYVIKKPQG